MIQTPAKLYLTDAGVLTEEPALFSALLEKLPACIRGRLEGREESGPACLSAAAWSLLAAALEPYGIRLSGESISFGPKGKPFLTDRPELHFNLSHSGRRAICLLSDVECGCDIQKLSPGWERISRLFFAQEEQETLALTPPAERMALFYEIWAAKESYLKARGTGIAVPAGSFSVCGNGRLIRELRDPEGRAFSFYKVEQSGAYACVCCLQKVSEEGLLQLQHIDLTS